MPSGCSRSTGRGGQSEALEAYRDARSDAGGGGGGRAGRRAADASTSRSSPQDPALDLAPPAASRAVGHPRPPPRRTRGLLVAAGALLLARSPSPFGVIRVLEPDGLPGIDEDAVGLIDGDSGPDHGPVRRRARATGARGRRRLGLGGQPGSTAPCRGSTVAANEGVTIDVGGEPTGPRVRAPARCGSRTVRAAPSLRSPRRRTRWCGASASGNAAVAIAAGYGAVLGRPPRWTATVVRIDSRAQR